MKKIMIILLTLASAAMLNATDYDNLISKSLFKGLNISQNPSDTAIENAINNAEKKYLNPLQALLKDTKNSLKAKPNDKLALENKSYLEKAINNIQKYLILASYVLTNENRREKYSRKLILLEGLASLGKAQSNYLPNAIRTLHEEILNKPKVKAIINSVIGDPDFKDWKKIKKDNLTDDDFILL